MRRRPRVPKKKNEKATGLYLAELLGPTIAIKPQFYLKQPIYDEKGILVRKFLYIDYQFILNGKEHYVEFDGAQHHRMVKKWGGWEGAKEKLRKQKIRDKWLKDYCEKNSINLITIDGRRIRGKKILDALKASLGF